MRKVSIWLLAGGLFALSACGESKKTQSAGSEDTTVMQAPNAPIDTIIPADTTSADTTHL